MSRRPPRIPGTSSPRYREIACGNAPELALIRALTEFRAIRAGEVWSVGVDHDDSCSSLDGGGMPACTCETVRLEARRAP
jgi:hypothetical protein